MGNVPQEITAVSSGAHLINELTIWGEKKDWLKYAAQLDNLMVLLMNLKWRRLLDNVSSFTEAKLN